jgi:hypothetical protein
VTIVEEKYQTNQISRFSTLKTKFDNPELLIKSLERVGLKVARNSYIRGRGIKIEADIVGCSRSYPILCAKAYTGAIG